MAFCSNCGHQLADGSKFCSACGNRVDASPMANNEQRKTVYDGEIHKCPQCGETLNSFVVQCPSCGHEIRDTSPVKTVKELLDRLASLENKRDPKEMQSFIQKLIYGDKISRTDQLKAELIRNFCIPNNKESIIEFLLLSASNISLNNSFLYASDATVAKAWAVKYEQAYEKAELLSHDDLQIDSILQRHKKTYLAITKQKDESAVSFFNVMRYWVFLIVGSMILLLVTELFGLS